MINEELSSDMIDVVQKLSPDFQSVFFFPSIRGFYLVGALNYFFIFNILSLYLFTGYGITENDVPDGISHTVEILDTAGSHHFPAMRELSIRSGRGFLLVYSVDSLQSFREATQLWQLIRDIRGEEVPVVLVGNKCDLEIHRQVPYDQATKTARETLEDCLFFEASAKFDTNVKDVFLGLLQLARNLEEAQEALLEEQDLFRRKSRRLSKRLSRKLSCFNNTFALKKNSITGDTSAPVPPTADNPLTLKKENPKCVLL